MNKRNLFAAFAALCALSALGVFSCDHALSQQTASVTFSLSAADINGLMNGGGRRASGAELARAASLAPRQAAGADGAYATLTVSLSEHAEPQTRFFREDEFKAVLSGESAIAPFDFTGLPVGARVTVTATILLRDGTLYEGSGSITLAVGPNSLTVKATRQKEGLALVTATPPAPYMLQQGGNVEFKHDDPDATIHLSVSPMAGVTQNGNAISGEVAGSGSVTLAFNNVATNANPYTVTAWATKGDARSDDATFTYTVLGDAISQVTASPNSGAQLTRGDQNNNKVTFSHNDTAATIHLSVSRTDSALVDGDFTVSNGNDDGNGTATGTGGSVELEFNTAGSYTVTAQATRDGYASSDETPFNYTVENPRGSGSIAASPTGGNVPLINGSATVTFSNTDTSATDAVIHLTLLNTAGVSVDGNSKLVGNQVTGGEGQSVTLTFTQVGAYNITNAYISRTGYQDTDAQTFNFDVRRRQLSGTITANKNSGTLTRGQTVTFTYTGDNTGNASNVTIHLPFDDVAGVTGGTVSGNEITGTGGSLTLTFNPTSNEVNPADKTYTIAGAYASLDDYQNSTPAADFTYTVEFPQLSGTISANPSGGGQLRWGDTVTFTYNGSETNGSTKPTIHLELNRSDGVYFNGSQITRTTVEGTSPVTLTLKPSVDAISAGYNFSIARAYATLSGYSSSADSTLLTVRVGTTPLNVALIPITGATVNANIGDPGGPFANAGTTSVTVNAFRIAETELTYAKWKEVYDWALQNGYTFANAGQAGSSGSSGNEQPVTMVSWRDAVVWCNAASEREGLRPVYLNNGQPVRDSRSTDVDSVAYNQAMNGYRLPTEQEWEFAARGGNPNATGWGYTYAGSNDRNAVAWNKGNAGGTTHDVKGKDPNSAQLYDMSGNVWEWCWDTSSSNRVVRGGDWRDGEDYNAVAYRHYQLPNYREANYGIRVVRSGTN